MIVQVWRRAMESGLGPVCVAAGDTEIVDAVKSAGGKAVLTDSAHPSGSDRIFEALGIIDPSGAHDIIINLQGDLPTIDPAMIRAVAAPLADQTVDIATLAAQIVREEEKQDPNVTKAVIALSEGAREGRGLYFTRATAPTGEGPLYHHIGIYGYQRGALKRFVQMPPSPLERRERLEQLRALEAGMNIAVTIVGEVPAGVDTPEDLERARRELKQRKDLSHGKDCLSR